MRFEPQLALSADEDGFADLMEIIASASEFLTADGRLIVEHGFTQADRVAEIMHQHSYHEVSLHHDLNKLPRCTMGIKYS